MTVVAADSVVVLTGATGCLGEAIARAVLQAGGRVAAAVRRPWQVEKLGERLGRERVLIGVVGARDAEAAAGFVKGATDALGPITALVGAAGTLQWRVDGKEPGGDLDDMLEANLHANATLVRGVLASMRRRRSGIVQLFGTPTENDAARLSVVCRTAKAAVDGYAAALHGELSGTGIDVRLAPAPAGDTAVEQLVRAIAISHAQA